MVKFAPGALRNLAVFTIAMVVLPITTLFWVRDVACVGKSRSSRTLATCVYAASWVYVYACTHTRTWYYGGDGGTWGVC